MEIIEKKINIGILFNYIISIMTKRIQSLDFVRGFVMIIMALDHVRDIIHIDSLTQNPLDLSTTSPVLFFTRWITHICAPSFVFLAGCSVYLKLIKDQDLSKTRGYLIKRGLILIVLEFTIVNFGIFFDIGFHSMLFQVIATIGFGFILLGLFLNLNPKSIGILGAVIILTHNLTPLINLENSPILKMIFTPLFSPTAFPISSNIVFIMGYPPIPWAGIMFLGYGFGKLFTEKLASKTLFIKLSLGFILSFVIIRILNIYGDPAPWTSQKDSIFTVLSFLNVSKYPPSLLFILVMLGLMFFIFYLSLTIKSDKLQEIIKTYGRVPLFYFIIHFYLIHLISFIIFKVQGIPWSKMDFSAGTFGRPKEIPSGVDLVWVFAIWIAVVAIMYLPSKWYHDYKSSKQSWWLKYI
jgi:uncharacterized membrane protein